MSVAWLPLLCGCGWDLPGSFRVGSIEVLDHADVGAILPWYAQQAPSTPGTVGLLRVEVVSPVNLAAFAKDHGFTVVYDAFHCDAPGAPRRRVASATHPMLGATAIADGGGLPPTAVEGARGPDGQVRYALFVPLNERPFSEVYAALTRTSNVASPLYDYRSDSGDLCFEIHGGDMLGRSYASPPLVVRHADILDAVGRRR